ncbi:PHD finger protein 10 [Plakobranchus ocellatus]|uniref:PHD finger protein 10 n=1 Tax=Plakobranchus ocellatus TaxID=259542 RepID=A0AAV4BCZ8_9GAST|nr:PHD finger protein 10 [Plakobranchus ocellatus]
MAAPIQEQSEELSATGGRIDEMEEPYAPVQASIDKLSTETDESEPILLPDSKIKESPGPSAFHVVSYPDGHKELTTDILEARPPVAKAEIGNNSSKISISSLAEDQGLEQREHVSPKHFSAKVVQREHGEGNDNVEKVHEAVSIPMEDESELLEHSESAVEMEGVNIEDIDNAVERAILDDGGEDSCGNFAVENSMDLEGLQSKGELNSGSDHGQRDGQEESQANGHSHGLENVLNIDEETRMGLDATPSNDQSLMKESFTYPSLPPKKLFQIEDTKDSEASDPDTKMSMTMTDTEELRLQNTISIDDSTNVSVTSDSNMEAPTPTSSRKPFRGNREGIGISQDGLEGERVFTAENLFEYQWPVDGGEWHLLQEQVSEYLSIKSFKRKYPDLDRRVCDKEEKDFLRDKGVVSETQSDLGLTALRSEEVYDLMMKDYNDKYQEYITFLQEKQKKVIREKHKEYSEQAKIDKSKMESYSKKAARSAAEFNANMMREKKDERRAYFDLQTYVRYYL